MHNTRKVSNEIALNTRSASVGVRARARACAWIIFAYTAAHAISEVVLALTGSERVFAGLRSVSASTPGSKESSSGILPGNRRINRRQEEEEEVEEGEEEEEKELAVVIGYETNVTRGRILMQRLRWTWCTADRRTGRSERKRRNDYE